MYGMLRQKHLTSVTEHPVAAFVLFAMQPCYEKHEPIPSSASIDRSTYRAIRELADVDSSDLRKRTAKQAARGQRSDQQHRRCAGG